MRGYGYVFAAAYKRRKKMGALASSLIYRAKSRTGGGFPYSECTIAAELYLLEKVKWGLRSNELKFLQWMCLQKRTSWGQMKIYSVWITGDKSNPKNL
jgi:hypothetical protein